jgi:hypothetical protein
VLSSTCDRAPTPPRAPSIRQVYALAGALCERFGVEWPSTRAEASAAIERLRIEIGHPSPRLEDRPPPRRRRRRRRRGAYPWWRHVKPRGEGAMTSDEDVREELLRAARERLRAQLAVEAEALGGDAESPRAAEVRAFLARLDPSANTT